MRLGSAQWRWCRCREAGRDWWPGELIESHASRSPSVRPSVPGGLPRELAPSCGVQAMNEAARLGLRVDGSQELVGFTEDPERGPVIAVEWRTAGATDWIGSSVESFDWMLRVQLEPVDDPLSGPELDERLERERASLAQLIEAPYGVWEEWLCTLSEYE